MACFVGVGVFVEGCEYAPEFGGGQCDLCGGGGGFGVHGWFLSWLVVSS